MDYTHIVFFFFYRSNFNLSYQQRQPPRHFHTDTPSLGTRRSINLCKSSKNYKRNRRKRIETLEGKDSRSILHKVHVSHFLEIKTLSEESLPCERRRKPPSTSDTAAHTRATFSSCCFLTLPVWLGWTMRREKILQVCVLSGLPLEGHTFFPEEPEMLPQVFNSPSFSLK